MYGDLHHGLITGNIYIIGTQVIPETVGQYTELKDKNGVKIFEGDVLACGEGFIPSLVFWDIRNKRWSIKNLRRQVVHLLDKSFNCFIGDVIGNIHDNRVVFLDSHLPRLW